MEERIVNSAGCIRSSTVPRTNLFLLGVLYLCETSLFIFVVSAYRADAQAESLAHLANPSSVIAVLALLLFILSGVLIVSRSRHYRQSGSKQFVLTVMMNLVAVSLILVLGELAVRISSVQTPEGPIVGDTQLLPRNWRDVVAHRRAIWEKASSEYGVFVFDDVLGWTVGSNRYGYGPNNESYFSSIEGIRAPQSNVAFAKRATPIRIALLGDSYTFSQDVNYEESWGHQLERKLGPNVQVLNFAVPAYGLDQSYLRYLRDVRPWHPDVVILGFISHNLLRSTMVYYSVSFPGAVVPGAKPRFVLNGNHLATVNVPLPSPDEILSKESIKDLPYIEYDRGYKPAEWEWHAYQLSYLLRFAISWFPPWPGLRQEPLDQETRLLNIELMRSFIHLARAEGSIPMVVFLPEYTEFRDTSDPPSTRRLPGLEVLQSGGIEHTNLTPCLEDVRESDRFTTGWHYRPIANVAIAECLQSVVAKHLSRM